MLIHRSSIEFNSLGLSAPNRMFLTRRDDPNWTHRHFRFPSVLRSWCSICKSCAILYGLDKTVLQYRAVFVLETSLVPEIAAGGEENQGFNGAAEQ